MRRKHDRGGRGGSEVFIPESTGNIRHRVRVRRRRSRGRTHLLDGWRTDSYTKIQFRNLSNLIPSCVISPAQPSPADPAQPTTNNSPRVLAMLLPSLPSLLLLLLLVLLFSSFSLSSSAIVPTHQHQGRAPHGTGATLAEVPDADVRSSFQVFDTDDDGYLSAKEVRAALGALANVPGGAQQFEARSFVDLGDEDGDGSLSLREFALALRGGKQETKAQRLQRQQLKQQQQQQKAGAQQRQRQKKQQQQRHVSMDLTAQKASASVNGLPQLLEVRSTIRRRSSLPSQAEGNEAEIGHAASKANAVGTVGLRH